MHLTMLVVLISFHDCVGDNVWNLAISHRLYKKGGGGVVSFSNCKTVKP